ncbi:hypothetical protein ACWEN3_02180 [Streptomyces sp. NPDC004561]
MADDRLEDDVVLRWEAVRAAMNTAPGAILAASDYRTVASRPDATWAYRILPAIAGRQWIGA